MSKFERIDQSDATPVKAELEFSDPKLQEVFSDESDTPLETPEKQTENIYRERLSEWRAAKAEYANTKSAYEERLAEYYRNYSDKSIFGRGSQRLSEWWDGKPEDLTALEMEYKAARTTYAEGLQDVLTARGESRSENEDFEAASARTRTAFADRFILEPKRDQLDVEKEHLHSTETVEQAQKILTALQKHKWAVRVGAVTATGLVVGSGAGIVAGVAAGGVKAGRIALGALGGSIGAKIGDRLGREGVEAAQAQLAESTSAAVEQFSVADIDKLETALTDAQNTVDSKERARKMKIIAGAVIGGGSMANIDAIGGAMVSEAHAAIPPDEAFEWTDTTNLEPERTDSTIPDERFQWTDPSEIDDSIEPVREPADDLDPSLAGNIDADVNAGLAAADAEAEAEEIAAETMRVLEETRTDTAEAEALAAETMEVLRDTTPVSDYSIESGDVLWNITKESYAPRLAGLSEAQQNQVLDAVFDELRTDPALTEELGVRSGNVDLIYENDVLKMSAISDLINEQIDSINTPLPEGAVEVTNGDTLWHLTKEAYSTEFEGLTEAQQNQVLDGVFDTVRGDVELTEELGVKSGNIDLIRPNEVMHLNALSELVEREVERVTSGGEAVTPTEITPELERGDPVAGTETGVDTVDVADTTIEATTITDTERIAAAATTLEIPEPLANSVLEQYGSVEAFQAAKLSAIEDIVGEQPASWGGGERFNPMYERIKSIPLSFLSENRLHEVLRLEQPMLDQFLSRTGMDVTDTNRVDLQTWHGFYRDIITPERLEELNITTRPDMTFDELFTEYVLRTSET